MLGFLMSAAFDQSLGRTARFSDDSVFTWLKVGVQSLVAPVLYGLVAILTIRLGVSMLQALTRVVPPLGDAARHLGRRFRVLGLDGISPSARGQVLVVLQVLSVVLVWVVFRDLIVGFTMHIDTADAAALRPLSAGNLPNLYRTVLTLLLLAMATAWYHLWVKQRPENRPDGVTLTGGLAVMVVVLLMLEVPYRLVYASYFQPVEFNGARCYVLGTTDAQTLLHCPASRPRRNVIVARDDVEPVGGMENLFMQFQ
jgi:hypothetical protein